jgi:hypothetical protein
MSRADELRAQADAFEAHDVLVSAYEDALASYRADPSDDNRTAYKAAAQAVADDRLRLRGPGQDLAVGGDAFVSTEG